MVTPEIINTKIKLLELTLQSNNLSKKKVEKAWSKIFDEYAKIAKQLDKLLKYVER